MSCALNSHDCHVFAVPPESSIPRAPPRRGACPRKLHCRGPDPASGEVGTPGCPASNPRATISRSTASWSRPKASRSPSSPIHSTRGDRQFGNTAGFNVSEKLQRQMNAVRPHCPHAANVRLTDLPNCRTERQFDRIRHLNRDKGPELLGQCAGSISSLNLASSVYQPTRSAIEYAALAGLGFGIRNTRDCPISRSWRPRSGFSSTPSARLR